MKPTGWQTALLMTVSAYKTPRLLANIGVRKFGKTFTKGIGDGHKRGRPGTAEDNGVNVLNNAAAIQYANYHPLIDPAEAADTM